MNSASLWTPRSIKAAGKNNFKSYRRTSCTFWALFLSLTQPFQVLLKKDKIGFSLLYTHHLFIYLFDRCSLSAHCTLSTATDAADPRVNKTFYVLVQADSCQWTHSTFLRFTASFPLELVWPWRWLCPLFFGTLPFCSSRDLPSSIYPRSLLIPSSLLAIFLRHIGLCWFYPGGPVAL